MCSAWQMGAARSSVPQWGFTAGSWEIQPGSRTMLGPGWPQSPNSCWLDGPLGDCAEAKGRRVARPGVSGVAMHWIKQEVGHHWRALAIQCMVTAGQPCSCGVCRCAGQCPAGAVPWGSVCTYWQRAQRPVCSLCCTPGLERRCATYPVFSMLVPVGDSVGWDQRESMRLCLLGLLMSLHPSQLRKR